MAESFDLGMIKMTSEKKTGIAMQRLTIIYPRAAIRKVARMARSPMAMKSA
jgi:hypothetical protein